MKKLLGYGAAAIVVAAAFAVLVLGEMRGLTPATKELPRQVAGVSPLPAPLPKKVETVPGDARIPAIERWLEAGGEGDETAMGDPATYDEKLVEKLVEKYEQYPLERRRERGALVYLLSRTYPEKDALAFLRRVIREKPCLSLENCASPATGHDDHDPSLATTLAYPQLMALAMAEQRAAKSEAPAEWRALAEEAKSSEVTSVKRRAQAWLAGAPQ